MRRTALLLCLLCSGTALAGCAGGATTVPAAAAPVVAGAPVTAGTTAITTAPPPTTALPVPTTSATAASAAGATEATAPPTPIVAAPDPDRVAAAYVEIAAALEVCLTTPTTCDPTTFSAPGSPDLERTRALLDFYLRNGYELRLSPEAGPTVEAIDLAPDGRSATIVSCYVDASTLVLPAALSGTGIDMAVNDLVWSIRVRVDLRLTEIGWRVWELTKLGRWEWERSCPA